MPKPPVLLPLWVRFAAGQKLAGLNALSPLYLRTEGCDYGCGDFGSLVPLIGKAKEGKFSIIQLLPLYDTGDNPSPYMPVSFFALNPIFLWVDDPLLKGVGDDLKEKQERYAEQQPPQYVNYGQVREFKLRLLKLTYTKLKAEADFETYKQNCCLETKKWAEFVAMKEAYGGDWQSWPEGVKLSTKNMKPVYDQHLFIQWILERQLKQVFEYADKSGVYLCFDRPLYPQLQGSDVWAKQHLFYLKEDGYPQYVSGCSNPQDPFGDQVWGHPVFRFDEKETEVRTFIKESVSYVSRYCHALRLDHVLALIWKYYLIDPDSGKGEHRAARGTCLLQELADEFPDTYFIAEDSGFESKTDIEEPLADLGLPGVRCPQWITPCNRSIHTYLRKVVAYTSTHDTRSVLGWWLHADKTREIDMFEQADPSNPLGVVQNLAKHLFEANAQLVMLGITDILGDTRRYNTPGTEDAKNWNLRMVRRLETIHPEWMLGFMLESQRDLGSFPDKSQLQDQVRGWVYPTYPQKWHQPTSQPVKLYIASSIPLARITVHGTTPGVGSDGAWGRKEVGIESCAHSVYGLLHVYTLPLICEPDHTGCFELALQCTGSKGETIYLHEIGKNFIINVL